MPIRRWTPRKTLIAILLAIVLLSIVAVLAPFVANPTSVTRAYNSAGVFAPLVFIILVMLAPTPGAIVGASGGAYFGQWWGALLLFIGNVLGVTVTFFLVRWLGRPAALRLFSKERLAQADAALSRHPYAHWFVYAIPIFPLELMTFVIALSNRSFKQFFRIVVTALPFYALLVTFIGSALAAQYKTLFDYASILIIIVMAGAIVNIIYAWNRKEIHDASRRFAHHMNTSVADAHKAVRKRVAAASRTHAKRTQRKAR